MTFYAKAKIHFNHGQDSRAQLFKGWITLSTKEITIQWISVNKTSHVIHWKVIYRLDSGIHLLKNQSQSYRVQAGKSKE